MFESETFILPMPVLRCINKVIGLSLWCFCRRYCCCFVKFAHRHRIILQIRIRFDNNIFTNIISIYIFENHILISIWPQTWTILIYENYITLKMFFSKLEEQLYYISGLWAIVNIFCFSPDLQDVHLYISISGK